MILRSPYPDTPPAPAFALTADSWYSESTSDWPLASMGTARMGQATATEPYTLHALGGRTAKAASGQAPLASHEVYDTRTNTWSAGVALPAGRDRGFAGTTASGIHFASGRNPVNTSSYQQTHWVLSGGAWTAKADYPLAALNVGGYVHDAKFSGAGGENPGGAVIYANTYSYDPGPNTWSAGTNLPQARTGNWVGYSGSGLSFHYGGWTGSALSVRCFKQSGSAFTEAATGTPTVAMCAKVSETELLVAPAASGHPVRGAYRLNVTANTWATLASNTGPGNWEGSPAFIDGIFYVAGGEGPADTMNNKLLAYVRPEGANRPY